MTSFLLSVACVGGIFFGLYLLLCRANPKLPMVCVSVGGHVFNAEAARTVLEQARGLSGRESLSENGGMLFIFLRPSGRGFWMKGMKFPIDIVWIREKKIVGFSESVQPEAGKAFWSLKVYYPSQDADMVLEVNVGAVKKYDLKIGDSVKVE